MVYVLYAVMRTAPKDTDKLIALRPNVALVLDGRVIDRIIETALNEAPFMWLVVWRPGEFHEPIRAGA